MYKCKCSILRQKILDRIAMNLRNILFFVSWEIVHIQIQSKWITKMKHSAKYMWKVMPQKHENIQVKIKGNLCTYVTKKAAIFYINEILRKINPFRMLEKTWWTFICPLGPTTKYLAFNSIWSDSPNHCISISLSLD